MKRNTPWIHPCAWTWKQAAKSPKRSCKTAASLATLAPSVGRTIVEKLPPTARQLVTFAFVGGTATATHVIAALVAHELGGLAPLSANFVGYICAVMVSYLGNAHLTFKRRALDGRQFVKFSAVSLMALALNQLLIYLCTNIMQWRFIWALLPTVILVPLFTFVMSRLWAFADPANPTSR